MTKTVFFLFYMKKCILVLYSHFIANVNKSIDWPAGAHIHCEQRRTFYHKLEYQKKTRTTEYWLILQKWTTFDRSDEISRKESNWTHRVTAGIFENKNIKLFDIHYHFLSCHNCKLAIFSLSLSLLSFLNRLSTFVILSIRFFF